MRSRFRKLGLLAALALVAGLAPLTQARGGGAATLNVTVGAFPSQTVPAESMRFFPGTIRVHQNDVLRFRSDGFHTATLLPASQTDPDAWAATNANPAGPGAPWALFAPDPDDGGGALKINNRALFPTDDTCGTTSNPCPFDATTDPDPVTGVLNSGLPEGPLDFSVQVTAAPGTTFHAICLVHNAMTMEIVVIPDADPTTTTQQQIDDAMDTRLRKDRRAARDLDERLSRPRSTLLPNGHRRWRAFAGFDTENIALLAMYPGELNIRRGDKVRWSASENMVFEVHTITGPRRKAIPIANSAFVPFCDPDGDGGPGPDQPASPPPGPPCADLSQFELDFPRRFVVPHGDGRVTRGGDLESAGVFGPGFGPDFYTLRFPRRLDDPWGFMCMIHPFMRGSVAIR